MRPKGKKAEPRQRDWMTGEGFTNGLTSADVSYIDSVVMAALDGGYRVGLDAAVEAVKRVQHSDDCYILYDENQRCVCEIRPALAAIEALGGER